MSGYVVVGDVSYKINIISGVIGKKEVPGGLFVFGIGYVPEAVGSGRNDQGLCAFV